jgi:AhpD family alkylhydroperoxidase
MNNRLSIKKLEPNAYEAMLGLESYLETTSLKPHINELIRIRASQLNGCAYCITMHTGDARKLGEKEHRLYALTAWKETNFFTEEEQVILALTEEVTLINKGVSEETYTKAIEILGEKVTAQVIMAAIVINAWNRIGVSTRLLPAIDNV